MNSLFKNKKIAIAPTKTRTVAVQPAAKKPVASLQTPSSSKSNGARSSVSSARSSPALSNTRSSPATSTSEANEQSSRHLQAPRRKANRQASPSKNPKFDDSDEDEDSGTSEERPWKRQRREFDAVDLKRQLRSQTAFSGDDDRTFSIIHAADIATKSKKVAENPVSEDFIVELQYPSASQRERFDLRSGLHKDELNSAQEIINIACTVCSVYLTDAQAEPFRGESNGKLIRELERARHNMSKQYNPEIRKEFKLAVDNYNSAIQGLMKDLAKNLDDRHDIPFSLVKLILGQVYDRAVSPDVDTLRAYAASSDMVYGELLAPLVDRIFRETRLTSEKVFVDLGSGVGNVVLQAALQIGCESWGCEIAPNCCKLARVQQKEFAARCRLWGIAPGTVHVEEGDFRDNQPVKDAIRRADVILVNNEVFSTQLNEDLKCMFLDCKDGCQIISLKPLAGERYRLQDSTSNNLSGIFESKKFDFYSSDVSWTDGGGNFFISTKDPKRLAKFSGQ